MKQHNQQVDFDADEAKAQLQAAFDRLNEGRAGNHGKKRRIVWMVLGLTCAAVLIGLLLVYPALW